MLIECAGVGAHRPRTGTLFISYEKASAYITGCPRIGGRYADGVQGR